MEINELAREVAAGIVNTGIEGGFGSVSCSTAGDYPSMGAQQVEGIGGRGDELLQAIPGGDKFVGRTYSDLRDSVDNDEVSDLDKLSTLLESEVGQAAQMDIIARDCEAYVQRAIECGLKDARCVIYAGMWGPTSTYVMGEFIKRRIERGYDIAENLQLLNAVWREQYAAAAGCDDYAEGYQNRADSTYEYVDGLDLSKYGY